MYKNLVHNAIMYSGYLLYHRRVVNNISLGTIKITNYVSKKLSFV